MQQKAIDKARKKLIWARQHYDELSACRNFQQFERAWMQFLVALDGIPIALNVCRHDNDKTRQWCGQKSAIARSDELLSYLHHSRNEDYHGLEDGTEYVPSSFAIGTVNGSVHVHSLHVDGDKITIEADPANGSFPPVIITKPHAKLLDVLDSRDKQTYKVPTAHLGRPLTDRSPASVALTGLTYYENYIKEAERLLPRQPSL